MIAFSGVCRALSNCLANIKYIVNVGHSYKLFHIIVNILRNRKHMHSDDSDYNVIFDKQMYFRILQYFKLILKSAFSPYMCKFRQFNLKFIVVTFYYRPLMCFLF